MPGAGGQQPQRTTFRPPWVKDGPNPLPMPAAPWTLNSRRESKPTTDEAPAFTKVTLKSVPKPVENMTPQPETESQPQPRKQSKITIIPSQPNSDKSTSSTSSSVSSVSSNTNNTKSKNASTAVSKPGSNGRAEPQSQRPQLERQVRIEKSKSRSEKLPPLSKSESTTGAPTLSKSSSRAAIPPPPPPRPPPPPPARTIIKDLPPLSSTQQKTLEMLKSRPRKRPDWACMMKEVESGRKLKHVHCNDRSAPLIETVDKVTADPAGKAHFVFESEKSNIHNQLLKQIQSGVKLKTVKTNDRSRPVLEGLRKFRRQLTIEEQIQKAEKAPVDEVVPDEMDDIDAVRDDLQSTKQMLALELRNKEALERDNKRLQLVEKLQRLAGDRDLQNLVYVPQARILNLEVEVERAKSQKNVQEHKAQDEKLTESLRKEAEQARKDAERLEKEFAKTAEERDKTKNELEDIKRMYAALERRMKAEYWESIESEPIILFPDENVDASWYDVSGMALAGCPSAKDVARVASQKSIDKGDRNHSDEEEEEEESSEEEEEEDSDAAAEKRLQREFKLLKTKIKNFKDKAANAKKERHALKEQIKQQNKLLKEEKKKFKHLQKEVDKMAKLMGDTDDEDHEEKDEDEEEEEEEVEETESEESEDESETDDSDLDDIWDDDDEDDPPEKRRTKLMGTVKKNEGRLAALKKGNYLLKAQVDRLKDDLVKQREESLSLQEDLDSVLAELG